MADLRLMANSAHPGAICRYDRLIHVERHVGPIAQVIHEPDIDILHVLPSAKCDFHVLVTSGMSERPMIPPPECPDCRYAELYLCLPASWPLATQAFNNQRNHWPIRLLQTLGRFPQFFSSWLWIYHTVPNFDPPKPYADGTRLCGAMLGPVISLPVDFAGLKSPGSPPISFFSVLALHKEEMDFKIKNGGEPLLANLFKQDVVADIVDPGRKSVIRKKRFGLF
jgi:hypothetical protein